MDDLESLERLMDNLRRQQSWVERAKSFFVDLTSAVGAGVAMLLLVALPVMLLWNAVATEVFNLNRIGYFQSCGLILLTRILFATSGHKKE